MEDTECCATESTPPPENAGGRSLVKWVTRGSLVSALLASACCWLPLVAIAFGASAAGIGAYFEHYRPYLLGVAAVLLGTGFYFLYVRADVCEPGSACAAPNAAGQRFSKLTFWVSALFIGVFAFFPSYVGFFVGGTTSGDQALVDGQIELTFAIEGMTCEACAAGIREELASVPGVEAVEVSYGDERATVQFTPGAATSSASLLAAIERSGYLATLQQIPASGDE